MASYVQWRAFIGPAWNQVKSDPYFFFWSGLAIGGALSPNPTATVLSASMGAGATIMTVADTSTYPNNGAVWVGPNAAGEGWESINYYTKDATHLLQCQGEIATNRDHNGHHTFGAAVKFWWPLTSAEGTFKLSENLDDALAVVSWQADLGGYNIPQAAIRNNHLIVVQWRQNTHSGSFTNFLIGWLDSPRANDDGRAFGQWSARIIDSAAMSHRVQIPGIRVGNLNIAQHGSASSSTSLASATKERGSGDYIAAYPDFSAGQVLNPDANAPWIGDRYIGTENKPVSGGTGDPARSDLQITQMYINPPPGTRRGSRWIELTLTSDSNVQGMGIFAARTAGPGYKQWDFKGPGYLHIGDHILLVEDEEVFTAENPSASPAIIYENEEFFPSLIAESGELGIRINALNRWVHNVKWGDGTQELPNIDGGAPGIWSGARIAAPGYGETMRYIYDPAGTPTNPVDWWEVGNIQSPGYDIDTSPDPWVQVVLPGMGLMLRDDISATVPGIGDILYIVDDSGPSTEGLADSGTLQIASEQVDYSAKSGMAGVVVSARNANGTTAADHAAEDPVYVVDTDGVATDAYPIKQIIIRRSGGSINLQGFSIRASNLPDGARTPDSGGNDYNNDYVQLENVVGNTDPDYYHTIVGGRRIKTILLKIARMTADPARPRINSIEALVDESFFNSDTWIGEGGTVANVFTHMLHLAHIPGAAILVTAPETVPSGHTTETGDALALVTAFAAYTGKRVSVGRDSKFTIDGDLGDFMIDPSPTPLAVYSRSNARNVDVLFSGDGGVSQVKLAWLANDDSAEGTVVYPAAPDVFGTVLELGPFVYADADDALEAAKKKYSMAKWPFTVAVETKDSAFDLRPGVVVGLEWELGGSDNVEMNRLFMVMGVDHLFKDRIGSTVFTAIQIDRTGGW